MVFLYHEALPSISWSNKLNGSFENTPKGHRFDSCYHQSRKEYFLWQKLDFFGGTKLDASSCDSGKRPVLQIRGQVVNF